MNNLINLKWLNTDSKKVEGVTWGIPWEEGVLIRDEPIMLAEVSGKKIPVQSWPTAYWPDGSVKWTAHATSLKENVSNTYVLTKGEPKTESIPLKVMTEEDYIEINTGSITCQINRKGSYIIRSVFRDKRVYCSGGKLVCIREERNGTAGSMEYREETFESIIVKTVIEQHGPVRAVIRVEGKHKALSGGREWLPFTLRLYFYAGMDNFKIMHTFVFNGKEHLDFIKGLGFEFDVPLTGQLYNRHVRFAGDTGIFTEALQLLLTWRPRIPTEIYKQQIDGKPLHFDVEKNADIINIVKTVATWDSYKIIQDSADHYSISKRTKEGCSWINSAHGGHSGGLAYAGGEKGGLAAGVRNFWEKHPTSLEINNMTKDVAKLKVWLWSPDCQPMDLRHYDTETHTNSYYEGFDELRSTPYGIANTSEITLWCFDETPERATLLSSVEKTQFPNLLICDPEYYHKVKAFGVWSVVDRSTETKVLLEDQLDAAIEFYKKEIDMRNWNGFWNYGDVMHTYDSARHTWRYDMGGFAWQNTELVPTLWLWYSYLRSGRADIFKMAEAMSRHTSEVDIYHMGEYAGLGSRHNVLHWGCGCKEARVSMASHHRFYYYLTGDERTGDILTEVKDADYATLNLDPMRAAHPKDEFPTHTRSGPDWAAFCSNWITMWERFEDTSYRDKLLKGIECLKNMPFRLHGAATFGYNPKTGELFHMGKENGSGSHLLICMGGPQIWMEMSQLIKDPVWDKMMADYGEFYNLPKEEKQRRTDGAVRGNGFAFPVFSVAMMAFSAAYRKDVKLAKETWNIVIESLKSVDYNARINVTSSEYITPISEISFISTNAVAQWCLNTIYALELIDEYLPKELDN